MLPSGTTIYTDVDVLDGASYSYRVQTLDPDGNNSDFTITPGAVRTLPSPPQPTVCDGPGAHQPETR